MVQVEKSAGGRVVPGSATQTGVKLLRGAVKVPCRTFGDQRIVVVARGREEADVLLTQAWDGPKHLRIGGAASDTTLEYFAAHLGLCIDDLKAFRAEVAHG